jgi:hypothetical protein
LTCVQLGAFDEQPRTVGASPQLLELRPQPSRRDGTVKVGDGLPLDKRSRWDAVVTRDESSDHDICTKLPQRAWNARP